MNGEVERGDVVVVGAGGGGAVLALALAKKGLRTIVLEQASGPPAGLRGEILQPNGQAILDRLGILRTLPVHSTQSVRHFHFLRAGGRRLCTVDYGDLPAPYNRAIVTLPNVAHHAILDALQRESAITLHYGTAFTGILRESNRVTGVTALGPSGALTVKAQVVVGADGAFSKVRDALKIPADIHLYPDGYLIAMLDCAKPPADSFYYVGHRSILGMFPAAGSKVYIFYMIRSGTMDTVKARGIAALRREWMAIDPQFESVYAGLSDWSQTAYMQTGRVRIPTWVTDGAVLIGDAAHAMNPHASQGRMQAMADAMALSEILPACLADGDCSAARLHAFERARRPHVTMLQRLADQQVFYWNTGNPIVAFLRDRVFQTLEHNARLRYQVLATTAGLRETPPFDLLDRIIAAGFIPDVRSFVGADHSLQ